MKSACRRLRRAFESHHGQGKQALESRDRSRFNLEVACSVALDEWGKAAYHNEHRWDYVLVDGAGRILAVEVHHATEGDVSVVIKKKAWGEERLQQVSVAADQWWWVPSGKATITPNGRGARMLAMRGIYRSRRELDAKQVASKAGK